MTDTITRSAGVSAKPDDARVKLAFDPKKLLWKLAGIALAVSKFAGILLKVKGIVLLVSMVASVIAYTLFYGVSFAVGLVALIAIHELGHMIAFRMMGVKTSLPVFIPLLGALITIKEQPKSVVQEAWGAIGGPLVGAVPAFALWGLAALTGSKFLLALAFVGMLINLFNLIPMLPLDGGRIVAAIHPAIWGVGLLMLGIYEWVSHSGLVLLILVVGCFELWERAGLARRWNRLDDPAWLEKTRLSREAKARKKAPRSLAKLMRKYGSTDPEDLSEEEWSERIEREIENIVRSKRSAVEIELDRAIDTARRDENDAAFAEFDERWRNEEVELAYGEPGLSPYELEARYDRAWARRRDTAPVRENPSVARERLRPVVLQRLREEKLAYQRVAPRDRVLVGVVYVSMIALLVWGTIETYVPRALGS